MIIAVILAHSLLVPPCHSLDAAKVQSLSHEVATAKNAEFFEPLASLHLYWRSVCIGYRADASRGVVEDLGGLLRYPGARIAVSSMLIDVGRDLVVARKEVNAAIK